MNPFEFVLAIFFMIMVFGLIRQRMGVRVHPDWPVCNARHDRKLEQPDSKHLARCMDALRFFRSLGVVDVVALPARIAELLHPRALRL